MIRIGVFTGAGRNAKPEPMIIRTSETDPSSEDIAYSASQKVMSDKTNSEDKES